MKTVKHILANKSAEVYSVRPETTVFQALEEMMNKNISALVVLSEGEIKGIFTERDYARKIVLLGRSSKETPVSEIMTRDLITISPSDTIDYCMGLMTDKHIRHLPVVEDNKVCGMISIGDVVKSIIEIQQSTIEQLQTYISS